MRRITVFNNISLDGYFTDANGKMDFLRNPMPDPEWDAFVAGNASGEGAFLFGRLTYELMASFWPTQAALQNMPVVAERMNSATKYVFSRTLKKADWNNTILMKGDLIDEVRKLKADGSRDMVIFGSGTLVSRLAAHGLIDEYQFVVEPVVIGSGRSIFAGIDQLLNLKLTRTRAFNNGNVLLCYELQS